MAQARTEQPSARKLQRARTRGVVARSPELSAAAALLALTLALAWNGERLIATLRALLLAGLSAGAAPALSAAAPLAPIEAPLRELGVLLLLPLCAAALAAAFAGFIQVGPLFAWPALAPDLSRLSPAERVRAWLSGERWLEQTLAALKLLIVLGGIALLLRSSVPALLQLPLSSPERALAAARLLLYEVALRAGLLLAVLGLAELVYQRARVARELRMTRRELEAEQRESYGAPEQRERRRRVREELRAQIAAAGIEQASVLLIDGAGGALALAFDRDDAEQRAPRVLEKGRAQVALRMQAAADSHGVPVRVEPALTHALFALELTEPIPQRYYAAVAEVFAALPSAAP